MDEEKIVIIFGKRLGYFKLFNENGELENEQYVSTEDGDYKRIFWRFYRMV